MTPLLMGVLNATPDSFSDGGQHNTRDAALARAKVMVAEGAMVIDIGGESTRPGADRVPLDEEQTRVLPVISALRAWLDSSGNARLQISIDTMNAATATAAISAGATIINDVSGGLADPEMLAAAAATDAILVIGHWRGFSDRMDALNDYPNGVAGEVAGELAERVKAALAVGVRREKIVLDPGLGFAKNAEQNWELLAELNRIYGLGFPVLIGASRKRFLASAIDAGDPSSVDNDRRDAATAALTALLTRDAPVGALWGFRVHDVASSKAALHTVAALRGARDE